MLRWLKALDVLLRGEATRPDLLHEGKIDIPMRGLTVVIIVLAMIEERHQKHAMQIIVANRFLLRGQK